MPIVIMTLVFVGVTLLILRQSVPPTDRAQLRQRVERIAHDMADDEALPSLANAQFEASFRERVLRPWLQRLALQIARLTPQGTMEATRIALNRAGNPAGFGVAEFLALRLVAIVVMFLVGIAGLRLLEGTAVVKLAFFGFSLIVGAAIPETYLKSEMAERQGKIARSLPDTLDLLIVSVEAGMGFDGAVAKVIEKVKGPLAEEFGYTLEEVRLGKSRTQALKDMATRIDLPEVTALVAAIYQADQMGVSISRVLRVQSETVRLAQMQRIRLAASKLPVKMMFPLVFFILPAIFIILLGPGMIKLLAVLSRF